MQHLSINYFADCSASVELALREDIGSGDISASLVPENKQAKATVITREPAVVCGRAWFDEVFKQLDPSLQITWLVEEGATIAANTELVKLIGSARTLLTGERCALNFLQTLMGTATTAAEYAKVAADSSIKILDTRKTIPGLRLAQKYAVATGGCHNHRIGLYDAFLIKENHIQACGSITSAISKARVIASGKIIEIEVESIQELKLALDEKVDIVMLDNFSDAMLQQAYDMKTQTTKYELSGNIELKHLKSLKQHKLDFMSSGALTKHCKSIDLSMRFL